MKNTSQLIIITVSTFRTRSFTSLVPRPLRIRHLQYEIRAEFRTASDERAGAWERGYSFTAQLASYFMRDGLFFDTYR